MSFGALPAWQALLLIGGAVGACAWLFFLKVRPPRVNVASLLLWRRVLDEARELTWWERVRRAVSLVATLLVAAALAVAVTRPAPGRTSASRGRLLIVIDSSWSMLARTSGGGTRWDHAVAAARSLAASAGGDDVALATTADGLVEGPTSDTALVETAIDRLRPSGAQIEAWPHVNGADAVHFFTDGAVARPLEPGVILHSVFDPVPNVAVTAFDVRPPAAGATSGEAYLEIANFAAEPQQVRVTLTRGTAVVLDQPVDLAAGEAIRQVVPLAPGGGPRLIAHVSAAANALAVDDDAVAWMAVAEPLAVTVVSADPKPLTDLLGHDPGTVVSVVAPDAALPDGTEVVIFDRVLPAARPGVPALVLGASAAGGRAGGWLGTAAAEEREPRWTSAGGHPVVAGVDPLTLDIQRARSFTGPALTAVARSETGTPLVSVIDASDQRAVVVAFSTADSNLAQTPAFPVLVGNALQWLARPVLDRVRPPGPMTLPANTSRVVGPDGQPVPLVPTGDGVVATLAVPGLYRVEAGGARSVVAVNAGAADVSNLLRTTLTGDDGRPVGGEGPTGRPWWMYAVAAAFVLIAVEWWTWQRRITV
jgi:von Willebrand factor type A domain